MTTKEYVKSYIQAAKAEAAKKALIAQMKRLHQFETLLAQAEGHIS